MRPVATIALTLLALGCGDSAGLPMGPHDCTTDTDCPEGMVCVWISMFEGGWVCEAPDAGAGGSGGSGGTGGAPLEPGLYSMDCSVAIDASNRIPFAVEFTLHATVDPPMTMGATSTLTTSAMMRITPAFEVLPLSEAVASSMDLALSLQGAEPTEILHGLSGETSVYAPFLLTDTQMTEITHDGAAESVSVEITQFSVTVTGLPEDLVPGGETIFPNDESECGDIHLQSGSSVIAFPVYP